MAEINDTTLEFFTKATPVQWSFVYSNYKNTLKAKAQRRTKKGGPEELIRLDEWYQEELPKLIHSRKELHITHEELVQLTKWKLMRGKFRPNLIDLVRINTENAVLQNSKKAFKRFPNLSGAMAALTCLKGVGPASASAILAAAFPEQAPFMADESMLSTPGVETMDYTIAEYLNFANQLQKKSEFLNNYDPNFKWNPHKVELTLWVHFVANEIEPSILSNLPPPEEGSQVSDDEDGEGEENEMGKEKSDDGEKNILRDDDSVTDNRDVVSSDDSNDSQGNSYNRPKRNKPQNDNRAEPSKKKCRI